MSKQQPSIAASRLEEYEQPVIYTSTDSKVWHVPVIENGMARSACSYLRHRTVRTTSLELYRQRRGVEMCDHCKREIDSNEYPENAPIREREA